MGTLALDAVLPTETLQLENGLSLRPRVRFNLAVFPSVASSATKVVDEWKLKHALLDFLKVSLSLSLAVPEDDLKINRFKDLKKRKRDDAVASGTLFIRDLKFLEELEDEEQGRTTRSGVLERKVIEWRTSTMEKMNGIELNLEGVKYRLGVEVPESDDFDRMKKAWEQLQAVDHRGNWRGKGKHEIDTIILRGVPSRWFAEPRVSSKPSMLVTHTVFSAFGRIRNLEVVEDNDLSKDPAGDIDLVSGLHCKILVQFEGYRDFYNALKVLCGRSLLKNGTLLTADYEVTWATDVYFRNSRIREQHKNNSIPTAPYPKNAIPTVVSNETRRKRFRE